jgi:hypothetical protein
MSRREIRSGLAAIIPLDHKRRITQPCIVNIGNGIFHRARHFVEDFVGFRIGFLPLRQALLNVAISGSSTYRAAAEVRSTYY